MLVDLRSSERSVIKQIKERALLREVRVNAKVLRQESGGARTGGEGV